ncbi:tRNA 2-thiouridine(34) synthase MnmA [Candidatus Uhrbacteria bacterium CG10_big_fil_rev_8_21_14_0_10_50_16]|uniref:tRNA-specific 2-thiouridylase MnmA n=1 Tax=Candidatus Uhrbacteria bacterium CG10_big_fil_rev_8_21_14_0_10_50_16 TaxID=1975039 RepID=A0A2H0RP83_9BACT|nr:MAG: tRNA 2-thiouridine(34) synthase MnmA [Candidatus Uhrbacteria bacterium CG10_big_fil_rev_8_21_14_0_10_50_16]
MQDSPRKILVAMSGGVDSSVAAALLLEQGHEVVGAFMKNWSGCDWETDKRDAQRVAAGLGIDFYVYDFEKEYRERVYEYMIAEYAAGRTPNPDVMCNREVKFDLLMNVADALGCSQLATGHYARIRTEGETIELLKGVDSNKDQSYFLCRLGQKELRRAVFPVGELTKSEVRRIAQKYHLATAEKKDSQGLCFVGMVDMQTFLKERIPTQTGPIVTTDGEVIGEHEGIQYYTIGQRHGLGVGGGEPWYVVDRRLETNELVVGHEDDPALLAREIHAMDVHWVSGAEPVFPVICQAKIRYRQEDQLCTVTPIQGDYVDEKGNVDRQATLNIQFDQAQRAVAPGQFVVFYHQDVLIGSAVAV